MDCELSENPGCFHEPAQAFAVERLPPGLPVGEHVVRSCRTERGSGSDAPAVKARAERHGDAVRGGRHGEDAAGTTAAGHRAAARRDGGASDQSSAAPWENATRPLSASASATTPHLPGGNGDMKKYQIERHLRDPRAHRIPEDANEIMRVIIARKLLEAAS